MNPTVPLQPTRFLQSTTSRASGIPVRIALYLLVSALSAGCCMWGNNPVKVKLAFTETDPLRRLTDVSVIVGSDKFFWHDLSAGEVETVTLMPGPQDDRQLTLLYTMDGEQKSWDGPKFNLGTGYRIEIKVDARGTITYRHCILPCSLD
jgi:hypothetical protein